MLRAVEEDQRSRDNENQLTHDHDTYKKSKLECLQYKVEGANCKVITALHTVPILLNLEIRDTRVQTDKRGTSSHHETQTCFAS